MVPICGHGPPAGIGRRNEPRPASRTFGRFAASASLRSLSVMNVPDQAALRRGRAANLALAAVFAVVLALEVRGLAATGRPWMLDCAAGVLACAAALLRSRGRVLAATAGIIVCGAAELAAAVWHLPGEPSAAATLGLLLLIASAVRNLPLRPAAAVAAGGAAVEAGLRISHPDLGSVSLQLWGAAVIAGLGLRFLTARRQAEIETVRRDERLDLARELHDTAAHHITGIVVQAQAARIAARKQPGTLDGTLADIESVGTDALAAMRRVIGLLRKGDGITSGPESLTALVDRFADRNFDVRLVLPDGPPDPAWPPAVSTTVYRVVSEALANITKHAPGTAHVTVMLAHDKRDITVEIADDAPPAHVFPHAGGYGIIGIRERVESLDGTLTAGPEPGGGWTVRAALPVPAKGWT